MVDRLTGQEAPNGIAPGRVIGQVINGVVFLAEVLAVLLEITR